MTDISDDSVHRFLDRCYLEETAPEEIGGMGHALLKDRSALSANIAELQAEIATLKAALAPFAKLVKDSGYDGTDHRRLTVTGRSSNQSHKNAYLALDGRFPLIGATTALRKE